jgi:hypothetical protein
MDDTGKPWKTYSRVVNLRGSLKRVYTRLFTGWTEDEYGAFLDSRFADPGELLGFVTTKDAPTFSIDGIPQWACFRFTLDSDLVELRKD